MFWKCLDIFLCTLRSNFLWMKNLNLSFCSLYSIESMSKNSFLFFQSIVFLIQNKNKIYISWERFINILLSVRVSWSFNKFVRWNIKRLSLYLRMKQVISHT